MKTNTYTTGQFAKCAGVSVRTIRYYDQAGLLKPSFIMENGYRCYINSDLIRLQKIITLKYLGFSLQEIKTMIMEEDPQTIQDSLAMQISLLDKKIQHMTRLKDSLRCAHDMLDNDNVDWNLFAEIVQINAQDEKIIEHYRNANNLGIRIRLHELFSTNPQGWFPWLYEHINFQYVNRLLEVGCGTGMLWKTCTQDLRNREVFLSDISQGMVETARTMLGEDYSYMVMDCQDIPFKKGYFDAVIANHVLFYVNDISKGLSQIQRVLRDEGTFYCSAYGKDHMKEVTALVQAFDSRIVLSDQCLYNRFGLENGVAVLTPYFTKITLERYEDGLNINQVQPLFDYVMSCHGNQNDILADRLSEFRQYLEDKMRELGYIHITKDAGLFICRK